MNTTTPRAIHLVSRAFLITLAFVLAGLFTRPLAAQAPLRITTAGLVGGKVMMTWTSNAYAYEVQSTASLAAPNWVPVLATARTNALLSSDGGASFFRIVGPKPNGINLVMNMTNLADSSSVTTVLQTQTNADLVFDSPTNTTGFAHYRIVYPIAELEKFDVAFDNAGGFRFVPANGGPVTSGGWWTISSGVGTNTLRYDGFLTNSAGMYAFSAAVSLSAARGMVSAQGDGDNPYAGITGGVAAAGQAAQGPLDGTICAGQWLGCQAACSTKAVACAFILKGVECNWTQTVTWGYDSKSNWVATCNGICNPQCK